MDYGLNVSWKTDVNSKQETFQVVYRRNDTGLYTFVHVCLSLLFGLFVVVDDIPTVRITSEWRMALRNLYPGACYQLKVFAISHGFLSEPHNIFQAICKFNIDNNT